LAAKVHIKVLKHSTPAQSLPSFSINSLIKKKQTVYLYGYYITPAILLLCVLLFSLWKTQAI